MKYCLPILCSLFLLPGCSKPEDAVAQSEFNLGKYNSLIKEIGIPVSASTNANDKSWGGITFTGSSTIALWTTLKSDFPGYIVRNTGWGGITLRELIANSEWMVFTNHPEVLVLYIGDNDATIYDIDTFKKHMDCFVENYLYRTAAKLVFISVKPSPVRKSFFDFYDSVNSHLSSKADQSNSIYFIDIWTPITEGGTTSYFAVDGLHLNSKGYSLITELLTPVLEGIFAELDTDTNDPEDPDI